MTVMSWALTPTALPASPMPLIRASMRSVSSPKPVASALDMAVRSLYSIGVDAAISRRSSRYRAPIPGPSSWSKAIRSSSRPAATAEPLVIPCCISSSCPWVASWTYCLKVSSRSWKAWDPPVTRPRPPPMAAPTAMPGSPSRLPIAAPCTAPLRPLETTEPAVPPKVEPMMASTHCPAASPAMSMSPALPRAERMPPPASARLLRRLSVEAAVLASL